MINIERKWLDKYFDTEDYYSKDSNPRVYTEPSLKFLDTDIEKEYNESLLSKATIYCTSLEGVHGVGKSSLIKNLHKKGYTTLPENFLGLFASILQTGNHVHNFWVESTWAGIQLLNIGTVGENIRKVRFIYSKYEEDNGMPQVPGHFFLDRSFTTGIVYGFLTPKVVDLYTRLCTDAIDDLAVRNIIFSICFIKNQDREVTFEQVSKRLMEEPSRKNVHEDDRYFFDDIYNTYEMFMQDVDGQASTVFTNEVLEGLSPEESIGINTERFLNKIL